MHTKTKIIVSSITILILTVTVFVFYRSRVNHITLEQSNAPAIPLKPIDPRLQKTDKNSSPSKMNENDVVANQIQEQQGNETDAISSSDFPVNIPIEQGMQANKSYSLNVAKQKQLSIVFKSVKSVEENYLLYSNFLKEQSWEIANVFENAELSSINGKRDEFEADIAITKDNSIAPLKSIVNINVIKK
jgi:hypothetical protein